MGGCELTIKGLERMEKLPGVLKRHVQQGVREVALGFEAAVHTGIQTGILADGTRLADLHPFTVLRRLAEVGPKQRDRMLEQMAAGKGARALYNHGDLDRSIVTKIDESGLRAIVGVNRTAKSQDGRSLINIADVLFKGRTIAVTPKMRVWLAANGLPLKKETTHIVIPARDPIRPTWKAYREKAIARMRQALKDAGAELVAG